ncbi:uncharacterized protein LOC128988782 [Macrosteles quadrilineatus]|uniref:uncharacterized protein LOC128988782 n=1 Tax=Macrosteles quadrilineatus TaxID=74068 RepID=UPI0023E29185|nr:uncharacterized protein LOC128988782 [Macrosteles quadrilineatus]
MSKNYESKATRFVDEAEKEASEVLHSLLSVERIERSGNLNRTNAQHEVVVIDNSEEQGQWHNELQHHGNIYRLENGDGSHEYVHEDGTAVVWESYQTLDVETTNQPSEHLLFERQQIFPQQIPQKQGSKVQPKKNNHKWKKKPAKPQEPKNESKVEENVENDDANDVRQRFAMGCECHDVSCFQGLNPDNVYRHRLNIAELTKEEHDMYLMGVTMACMSDPGVTVKQRERRRLRAQYVYQGRRVCLSAFLYLENCTLYQLKRIRKHVMTHGVTPRVHGNHGKKPHNVFSLETYRRATEFLKSYIEQHNTNTGNCKNTVIFPPEISRKTIHNLYQGFMKKNAPPEEKTMGYSTFRHFMKEQFPHVRFCKIELGTQNAINVSNTASKQSHQAHNSNSHRASNTEEPQTVVVQPQTVTQGPVQAITTIPLIIQEPSKPEMQTYIVTPMVSGHTITVTPVTNYAFTTL